MKLLRLEDRNIVEIKALFTQTFTDSEGQEEGSLIGSLVEDFLNKTTEENLYIFAAFEGDKMIACIFFSKLTFEKSNIKAFLLSPVAVKTAFQKNGIGQKLINLGHAELKKEGIELVMTYGDINFYSKVAYQVVSETIIPAPLKLSYPEAWLGQSLSTNEIEAIEGKSFCVEALNKPKYW